MMLKPEDYAYQAVTLNEVTFILNSNGTVIYKVDYYTASEELAADGLDDSYKYGIRNITGGSLKNYAPEIDAHNMVFRN